MANTYSWDCRTVDAYPTHTDESGITESQVVYNVHWRVTGTDGTHSATSIGTQTLETSDLSGFTAFDEVTHDDMVAWTQAALGVERVAELEASLDSQIADLVAPKSVTLTIAEPTPEIVEVPVEEAPAE
jgi:hypothetical protein